MNRRAFSRFIEELRYTAAGISANEPAAHALILDAFRRAMFQRRRLELDDAAKPVASDCLTPSPGNSGEGWGEGHFLHVRRKKTLTLPSPGVPGEGGRDQAVLMSQLQRGIEPFLDQDDLLGQVYQSLNVRALEAAYQSSARDRRKFSPEEIPAVSQLFTPRWVVEFLLHNTLGRLWLQWHPTTRLREKFCWMVGESIGTANGKLEVSLDGEPCAPCKRASEIRFLDPACGTMNFGLVAFDMLGDMCREELDRAGEEGWPTTSSVTDERDIASSIVRNNLFGIDIDPVALCLARASLEMKSEVRLPHEQWNLWQADALFDTDIAEKCDGTFDVVATNPPYISSRNLPAGHVAKMKKRFPSAWRDLYACFIERSLDFAREGGRVGLLAMQSFMFTGAYERLRARITERSAEITSQFRNSDECHPEVLRRILPARSNA